MMDQQQQVQNQLQQQLQQQQQAAVQQVQLQQAQAARPGLPMSMAYLPVQQPHQSIQQVLLTIKKQAFDLKMKIVHCSSS